MDTLPLELRAELFPLLAVFAVVTGGCIGSFLNVVVWRLPRGESLLHPPSRCPKCGTPIKPWHNLPVFGWLLLRGRCAACHLPISSRYPLVEGATALLFLAVWWQVNAAGWPWSVALRAATILAVLLAVSLTDLDCRLVPDRLVATGLAAAVGFAALWPGSVTGLGRGLPLAGGDILTAGVAEALAAAGVSLTPRLGALLLTATGLVVGAGLLAALRLFCNLLWGGQPLPGVAGQGIRLTSEGLAVGEGAARPLAGWLPPGMEWVRLTLADTEGSGAGLERVARGRVTVEWVEEGWLLAGRLVAPPAAVRLAGRAVRAEARRDMLGLGDVKLMALIGAFLGPDAALVSLLPACGLALAGELLRRLLSRSRPGMGLPFAPWLALGAAASFFFGDRLVLAGGTAILSLLCISGVL
ncbi:MAG: prepilin peptidase [Lentisphaeria bacterium]